MRAEVASGRYTLQELNLWLLMLRVARGAEVLNRLSAALVAA